MTWSLVLGGAKNVYDDLNTAIALFGEPDVVVCVKDIWMEYPKVDHVCTYHTDRLPRELTQRRSLGYPDPTCFWTYSGVRPPRFPIEIKFMKVRGGSSGLLGAYVGKEVADRAILAGIPMDMLMPHYHQRKHGKPWAEARLYKPHWEKSTTQLMDKVKSMSGFTQQLLGAPTEEWVKGNEQSQSQSIAVHTQPAASHPDSISCPPPFGTKAHKRYNRETQRLSKPILR